MFLTIQYIYVKPASRTLYSYSINDSLESHVMSYDNMYQFLSSKVSRGLANKILELISRHESFVIDINQDKAFLVAMNEEEKRKELSDIRHSVDIKAIEEKSQEFIGQNRKDTMQKDAIEAMQNKALNIKNFKI